MNKTLSKQYNPKEVEKKIYDFWQKNDFFKAKPSKSKKSFTIVIPPPNVTGVLHMGHALNNTVIDILIRRARMRGFEALYLPGTDHAGIATQNKVEQKLAKNGKTRKDLGREKFVQKVWEWKDFYEKRILDQLRALGASCDWSRTRFTMDDEYSKAVEAAFTHYYEKGLIYRGTRVINWCPRCQSSISDLEVKYIEKKAKLYYFRYDKNFPIAIATTRPETKLGDTGVAVNPKDKRFQKYIGKNFDIDFSGVKRRIKIVADVAIDPEFGSGAVGLTPAHSIIDEKIAKKNDLAQIKIIDENGLMTTEAGSEFSGLKTTEAREKVIDYLRQNNLLEKEVEFDHSLAICDRCRSIVEPLPSKQWFLKMKELAEPAIQVVEGGKIKFHPGRWKKVYLDWLKNADDWCISRQIWWGHRLPVWQSEGKTKNEKVKTAYYIGDNPPKGYEQVDDVLDTWFSSALWPFATLGWPRPPRKTNLRGVAGGPSKTKDLEYFYPTQILSTARDIIFLWVARMVFSSLEFTGKIPFKDVFIHPTVLTSEGKRMSKSLGTGVDPIELIEKYGADATRFGIAWQLTGLQDLHFKEDTILASRNFANKIWNATRFVLLQISKSKIKNQKSKLQIKKKKILALNTQADIEIIQQLNQTITRVNKNIDSYSFGHAAQALYHFFWHEFCDKYLEESKNQLQDEKLTKNTQEILFYVLTTSLKLIHPFMPFVTEEIWQILGEKQALTISKWPEIK